MDKKEKVGSPNFNFYCTPRIITTICKILYAQKLIKFNLTFIPINPKKLLNGQELIDFAITEHAEFRKYKYFPLDPEFVDENKKNSPEYR